MKGRRVATLEEIVLPGDYATAKVEKDDWLRDCVYFLLPIHEGTTKFDRPTQGSGLHSIISPPWTFRECGDGSLEIRPSIGCGDAGNYYWHGFLDEGHNWRQV